MDKRGIKVEKVKIKMFNFLCKIHTACKMLAYSEKNIQFLFWLIKDFQGIKESLRVCKTKERFTLFLSDHKNLVLILIYEKFLEILRREFEVM